MDVKIIRRIESLGYSHERLQEVVAELAANNTDFKLCFEYYETPRGRREELIVLKGGISLPSIGTGILTKIWLPYGFPSEAPRPFVHCAKDTWINPASCVDADGRIDSDYVKNWTKKSSLLDLIKTITIAFRETKPLFSLKYYIEPNIVKENVYAVMRSFPLLKLVQEKYEFPDEVRQDLLSLKGQLCVEKQGIVHMIPVRIWLARSYPYEAPLTSLKAGITNLKEHEQVNIPYLKRWNRTTSNLKELLEQLTSEFEGTVQPRKRHDRPQLSLPSAQEDNIERLTSQVPNITVSDAESAVRHVNKSESEPNRQPSSTTSKRVIRDGVVADTNFPTNAGPEYSAPYADVPIGVVTEEVQNFIESHGLSTRCRNCLVQNNFSTVRQIRCMKQADIDKLNLPLAQAVTLRESIENLRGDYYMHIDRKAGVPNQNRPMSEVFGRAIHGILKQMLIDQDDLVIGEEIGRGQFGIVFKGLLNSKYSVEAIDVAVKTILINDKKDSLVDELIQEILQMRTFKHKNVMGVLGIAVTKEIPYVILPFMAEGNLKTYVSDTKQNFTLYDLLKFGHQVAEGMNYLAQQNFIHGDLAARNCLVHGGCVKVADFGLTRQLFLSEYYKIDPNKEQPIRWMALEVLMESKYTIKSDVWAFAILLWEVLTRGIRPYKDINDAALIGMLRSGYRLPTPEHAPEEIYRKMQSCWEVNQTRRPTFGELCQWFKTLLNEDPIEPTPPKVRPRSFGNFASGPNNTDVAFDSTFPRRAPPLNVTESPPPLPPRIPVSSQPSVSDAITEESSDMGIPIYEINQRNVNGNEIKSPSAANRRQPNRPVPKPRKNDKK